jgi:hypothetical protein
VVSGRGGGATRRWGEGAGAKWEPGAALSIRRKRARMSKASRPAPACAAQHAGEVLRAACPRPPCACRRPPWSFAKMRGSMRRMVSAAPSTSNCLQVSSRAMLSCTSLTVEEASSCGEGGKAARGRQGGELPPGMPQKRTHRSWRRPVRLRRSRSSSSTRPEPAAVPPRPGVPLKTHTHMPSSTCVMVGMQAVRALEKATAMAREATNACSSSSVPSKPTSAAAAGAERGGGEGWAEGWPLGRLRCLRNCVWAVSAGSWNKLVVGI